MHQIKNLHKRLLRPTQQPSIQ